jgi:hypothetical protein
MKLARSNQRFEASPLPTVGGDQVSGGWIHVGLRVNVGFFVDATQGWEYYLGVFYVLFTVLIIWRAYTWPKGEQG